MKSKNIIILMVSILLLSIGVISLHNNPTAKADTVNNVSTTNPLLQQSEWPTPLMNDYGIVSPLEASDEPSYVAKKIGVIFDKDTQSVTIKAFYFDSNGNLQSTIKLENFDWTYSQNLGDNNYYFSSNSDGSNDLFNLKFDDQNNIVYTRRMVANGQHYNDGFVNYQAAQTKDDFKALVSNNDSSSSNQVKFVKNMWPPVLIHNYGMISKIEKSHNKKYAYQRVVITFDSNNGRFYVTTLYYSNKKQFQHQSITKKGIKLNYFSYLGNDTFYLADGKYGNHNQIQFKFNTKNKSIHMKRLVKNGKNVNGKETKYRYVRTKKDMEKISN